MKLTFLLNYETASLFAFSLLEPTLSGHDLTILYTQDKGSDAPKHSTLASLRQYDLGNLPTFLPLLNKYPSHRANHVNDADLRLLVDSHPDLVISIRHMSILRSDAIKVAKQGVLNLHSGLLPDYRGVMASFWAMLNGEEHIGSTLHWIEDAQIDKGGIISTNSCRVDTSRSYYWNVLNLYRGGCRQITKAIQTLSTDTHLQASPQTDRGQYYSWPKTEHLETCDFKLFDTAETLPF